MPVTVAPAAGASLPAGTPVTFQVRPPVAGQAVAIAISGLPDRDDNGALRKLVLRRTAMPLADPAVAVMTVAPAELLEGRPGRYYWQALVGEGTDQVAGPVGTFTLTQPAAARQRSKIPTSIGRHASFGFYLSTSAIPGSVGRSRFKALSRQSARRWGLDPLRWTSARPGKRDGWSIVGFGSTVTGAELGVERELVVQVFRHHQQCLTLRGPDGAVVQRTCRELPATYVGQRTVERDITLRRDIPWSTRPDGPDVDRYDLETVLLHELGHMAGNKKHRPRCANSPMVESLGTGEWWHTPTDSFQFGCADASALASAASVARGRLGFARLVVVVGDVVE